MRKTKKKVVIRGEEDNTKLEEITKWHLERNLALCESIIDEDKKFFVDISRGNCRLIPKLIRFIETYYKVSLKNCKEVFGELLFYICDFSEYEDRPLSDFSKKNNKKYVDFSNVEKKVFEFEKKEMKQVQEVGRLSNLNFVYSFIKNETVSVEFKLSEVPQIREVKKRFDLYSQFCDTNRKIILRNVEYNNSTFDVEAVALLNRNAKNKAFLNKVDINMFVQDLTNYCQKTLNTKNKRKNRLNVQAVELEA